MKMIIPAILIVMLSLGADASAQDSGRERMSREQADAYLKQQRAAVSRSNLTAAVMRGDVKSAEALIAAGVDPNEKDTLPQSVLELAATSCIGGRVEEERTVEMIGVLLDGGADPNAPGMMGALMTAAQQCTPTVVKRLIKGGAKLDARTAQGYTPLSMALIVAKYDNAEALIDAGARLSQEGAKKLLGDAQGNDRLIKLIKRATAKQ